MYTRKKQVVLPAHITISQKRRMIYKNARKMPTWQRKKFILNYKRQIEEIKRIQTLKEQVNAININFFYSTRDDAVNMLVEIVDVLTKFYDAGEIQHLRRWAGNENVNIFNSAVKEMVRRKSDAIYGYINTTKPGETVTEKNLLFGDAVELKGKSKGKIIKEYNGVKYEIRSTMQPISRWKRGNVKTFGNHEISFNYGALINHIEFMKKTVTEICDYFLI